MPAAFRTDVSRGAQVVTTPRARERPGRAPDDHSILRKRRIGNMRETVGPMHAEFAVKNIAELVPVFIVLVDDAIFRLIEHSEAECNHVQAKGVQFEGDDLFDGAPANLKKAGSASQVEQFHAIGKQVDAMRWKLVTSPAAQERQAFTYCVNEAVEQKH